MAAELDGAFGKYLMSDVERRIIEDNELEVQEWQRKGRKRYEIVPYDPVGGPDEPNTAMVALTWVEDKSDLATFALIEDERLERKRQRDRDNKSKQLTPKEREIVDFLRYEYRYEKGGPTARQAVASAFGIAYSTAQVHIRNISGKFSA